ncbi:hypothetical protein FACS1894167_13840 [Synergistales bacterium]|nr:hypothetical protein FACS1894167_13840 [Synergistales bacterium]
MDFGETQITYYLTKRFNWKLLDTRLKNCKTLLGAGKSTNFIYRVDGLPHDKLATINAIDTECKIRDRIVAIRTNGGVLSFVKLAHKTFDYNMSLVDSEMATIVAEMLVAFFSGTATTCEELLKYVTNVNPLSVTDNFYRHKVKELLYFIALGMTPATTWDYSKEAMGGYIVVKLEGEITAYNVYNRELFKDFLLNSTRFEAGGITRHDYAKLYEENGSVFVKLNLQIRFV